VEKGENQGTKVTMTIKLQKQSNTPLRASALTPDLYGGRDSALIELSDVLPHWLFNNKDF
jgi:hypothetical protein